MVGAARGGTGVDHRVGDVGKELKVTFSPKPPTDRRRTLLQHHRLVSGVVTRVEERRDACGCLRPGFGLVGDGLQGTEDHVALQMLSHGDEQAQLAGETLLQDTTSDAGLDANLQYGDLAKCVRCDSAAAHPPYRSALAQRRPSSQPPASYYQSA